MICPNPLEALQRRDIAVHKEPSTSMVQFTDWNKPEKWLSWKFWRYQTFYCEKTEKKGFYFSTSRPSSQQLQHSPERRVHFFSTHTGTWEPSQIPDQYGRILSHFPAELYQLYVYILLRKVSCSSYDLSAVNWNSFALPLVFIKIPPMSLNLRECVMLHGFAFEEFICFIKHILQEHCFQNLVMNLKWI